MSRDVDALREVLLALENQQRSPPESFVVEIGELARDLSRTPFEIREAIECLAQLEFIEGPGAYNDDWLFRRLSGRGAMLADAIRKASDWRRVKDHYAPMMQSR